MSADPMPARMPAPRVVAEQLSLLGDAPVLGYAWTPTFYLLELGGGACFPPDKDQVRQVDLLTAESRALAALDGAR